MDIGELIAYVSPLIPIAASIVNDWEDWRKKHTKRSNVVLMILAIVFAWAMIWYDNQGHRKQAHEQAQALSELEAQRPDTHNAESRPAGRHEYSSRSEPGSAE